MRGVTRWRRGMRGSGECVSQIGGDGVRCWYGDIHVFFLAANITKRAPYRSKRKATRVVLTYV